MNTSGDAAEQIVRLSIEGVEMAAKVVGSGAKELATYLFAMLRDGGQERQQKGPVLKGRERLKAMLKSGKELKVFALKEADLKAFCSEARRFGVGYYVVRGHKKNLGGLCDVMVPAEQASMVSRIVERFGYQPTDRATLQTQVERDRGVPTKNELDILLDEAMGAPQQRDKPAADFQRGPSEDGAKRTTPAAGGPPAPGSAPKSNSAEPSSRTATNKKPSVKKRIDDIAASLKRKPPAAAPQHTQPKPRKKKKGSKAHGKG